MGDCCDCCGGPTSVRRAVAVRNRVVGEQPVAQRGEGEDIHPLVLREALPHTQHREEVARHGAVQLRYRHRLRASTQYVSQYNICIEKNRTSVSNSTDCNT